MPAITTRHFLEVLQQSTQIAGTDTGSGADAGEALAFSDTDTGAGVDTESVAVALTDTDIGAGLDTESVNTDDSHPSDTENTPAGADGSESITVTVSSTDTGTGTEGTGTAVVSWVMSGRANTVTAAWTFGQHLGEVGSGRANMVTATRAGPLVLGPLSLGSSDTGTGTDAGEALTVTTSSTDVGAWVEIAENAGGPGEIFDLEDGLGQDAGEAVTVTISDTDIGSGLDAEYQLLVALETVFDTGTGVDGDGTVNEAPLSYIHGTAIDGIHTTTITDGRHATVAVSDGRHAIRVLEGV